MSFKDFVVIDIETSHFSPDKGGMIIEVAAVRVRDGKITETMHQLINPERKISKQITELTGITNDMLTDKPTFREVIPALYQFIGESTVIAHNAKFDWDRYLKFFLKKVGIMPLNPVIDTMSLSRKYLKNDDKNYKLGYLCELVNVKLSNHHRALADAIATAELFIYLKDTFNLPIEPKKQESYRVPVKDQDIRNVAYWEKKHMKRIYVTLERGSIFYDIPSRSWEVKASDEPLDFKSIEFRILKMYGAQGMNQLTEILKRRRA